MGELPVNSCMQFNGYEVNHMSFDLFESNMGNKEIQITPSFETSLKDAGDDHYMVQLSISIKSSNENPLPFNLDVIMTGNFSMCMSSENGDLKRTLLKENTVAIMFPFLRAIVASLTSTANISPLVLPVINLVDAFKDK